MSVIKKIQIGTSAATDIGVDWSNISNKPSLATLGTDGKVPSSQLPSYVDDVLEYSSKDNFPKTGETGKIYVDTSTNLTYRWGGSAYIEISPSLALGETDSTAYAGSKGKANAEAISAHRSNTNNPHGVTKAQVGLGNVDNTADKDKPISIAVQAALNGKYVKPSSGIPIGDLASAVQISLGKADTALQSHQDISGKLDKTTYEYNKEIAFKSYGYLCIGKFPCYDSNITIYIDSTTRITYHGVLVVATQNINTSKGGDLTVHTYGDASNTLSSALKLEYNNGSNSINIYFQPQPWSKNLIHIRCAALAGTPTDVVTSISSIPSTATIVPTNMLKSALNDKASSSHRHGNITNAGAIGNTANKLIATTANGVLTASTALAASSLAAGSTPTVSLSGGTLTFGIPKGDKGDTGPTFTVGTSSNKLFLLGTTAQNSNITNAKTYNAYMQNGGVYCAVWNDLSDSIPINEDCKLEHGYCYCFDGEKYYKSSKYLDNGVIGIHSDTFGLKLGTEDDKKKLDVAVAGFALAYVDKEYPPGTPLTCTENGYLTEIKKQDKIEYPEKIVATYWKNEPAEEWGTEERKVKVNGRKWVKIK